MLQQESREQENTSKLFLLSIHFESIKVLNFANLCFQFHEEPTNYSLSRLSVQ